MDNLCAQEITIPYITKEDREYFAKTVSEIRDDISGNPKTVGQLNYLITTMIDEYTDGQLCYQTINDVMGVLECVKQEYYRRVAVDYEQKKCKENGDVYGCNQ